jgi:hypothetical protein
MVFEKALIENKVELTKKSSNLFLFIFAQQNENKDQILFQSKVLVSIYFLQNLSWIISGINFQIQDSLFNTLCSVIKFSRITTLLALIDSQIIAAIFSILLPVLDLIAIFFAYSLF